MEPISHLVWMTEHMNLDREKEEAKEENALIDEKKNTGEILYSISFRISLRDLDNKQSK